MREKEGSSAMEDKKELLCLDNTDIFIPQFEERDVRICAQKYLVGVCVAICTMGLLKVLDSYPFYDLSWNRCATFADSARIFFVIISLVVTTNFWKRVWRSQSLGVLDGFLCSYVALGLYLATHLFLHPAMLLVAFVVCALVALVGLRVESISRGCALLRCVPYRRLLVRPGHSQLLWCRPRREIPGGPRKGSRGHGA